MKSFRFRVGRSGKRKVEKPSTAFTPKDWVSFAFSLFAAIVSAITAYFSLIVRTDELRVQAIDKPLVGFDREAGQYRIDGTLSLIFINSGNQPASIFKVVVAVADAANPRHKAQDCVGKTFDTDLQPFVLKENEITFKTMKLAVRNFDQVETADQHPDMKFIVPQYGLSTDRKFTVCARIAGTSVMEQVAVGDLELYEAEFGAANGGWVNYSFEYLDKPKTIWHKIGTIFNR